MDVMINEKPTSVISGMERARDAFGQIRENADYRVAGRGSLGELNVQIRRSLVLAKDIVRLIENGDEPQAYTRLVGLLDSVRIFFTVFSQDLGWAETPEAEISREESSLTLERALTQLAKAHKNRFWISMCDVIEYEITPLLESWQALVERTHAQANWRNLGFRNSDFGLGS